MRCEVVFYCSWVIVSGLLGLCQLSSFGKKKYAASRLLRSATWCACLLSLFYWFSAEKVCLWAVPLFKRDEKKRKLKQPLYNLNFGLPLGGGTSLGRRLLHRQYKGLSTELIGLLVAPHWSHFSGSQRPFQLLPRITNSTNWTFSACSSGSVDNKRAFSEQSFFKSHFCSTFSLGSPKNTCWNWSLLSHRLWAIFFSRETRHQTAF